MTAKLKILALAALAGIAAHPALANTQSNIATLCAAEGLECLHSDNGLVIGRAGTTASFETSIQAAAQRFEHYFGAAAPTAAVVLGGAVEGEGLELLHAEYGVVLPWLSQTDRLDMIRKTIRTTVKAQKPELSGDALDAVVEQSLKATLAASKGMTAQEKIQQGALAHELGHLYFIRTYWPEEEMNVTDVGGDTFTRYGGPAPDWLDEMAAVLLETDALTDQRWSRFRDLRIDPAHPGFWPLDDYLSMEHPAFQQAVALIKARQNTAEGRAKGGVVVLRGDEVQADPSGRSPALFYVQSRAFADFLIEASGETTIFASVAQALASGNSFSEWLDMHADRLGLPATVTALENRFTAWSEARASAS